jgi:hypothetical protein
VVAAAVVAVVGVAVAAAVGVAVDSPEEQAALPGAGGADFTGDQATVVAAVVTGVAQKAPGAARVDSAAPGRQQWAPAAPEADAARVASEAQALDEVLADSPARALMDSAELGLHEWVAAAPELGVVRVQPQALQEWLAVEMRHPTADNSTAFSVFRPTKACRRVIDVR